MKIVGIKYRDIVDRDFRKKGRRQREDDGREKRCLEEKYREGNRSSDRSGNKCGFERMREITVEKKPFYVLVAWKSLLCFLTKVCDFEVKGFSFFIFSLFLSFPYLLGFLQVGFFRHC